MEVTLLVHDSKVQSTKHRAAVGTSSSAQPQQILPCRFLPNILGISIKGYQQK